MKFILTICLSLCLLFFNHCSVCSCKKVPCPAFSDPNFNAWFPYRIDQQLIFHNNARFDTVSLYVEKSEAYEGKQGCYGASTGCMAHAYIYSNELFSSFNRKLQITINVATAFGSNSSQKNISFSFYQLNGPATDIVDTGLVFQPGILYSKYYSSLGIGNTTYNNVQLIKKDTVINDKYSGPYKIYLAKNIGIVAYETYPDLKTWMKQ